MPHFLTNVTNFRIVTGPTVGIVSLKKAKDFLRVSTTHEDSLINAFLTAATEHVEQLTGRLLLPQTWDLFLDRFPLVKNRSPDSWWDGVREGPISQLTSTSKEIPIWKAPIQSIEFLKTFDDSDNEFIFPATSYIADTINWPSRIVVRDNQVWPTTNLRAANAIQIRFKAGYANAEVVPKSIADAVLLVMGHLYENRGDETSSNEIKFPKAATMLLNNFILRRI